MSAEQSDEEGVTVVIRNGARRVTIIFENDALVASLESLDQVGMHEAGEVLHSAFAAKGLRGTMQAENLVTTETIELSIERKLGGKATAFQFAFTSPRLDVIFRDGKAKVRLPRQDFYHYEWSAFSTPGDASIELSVKLGDKELQPPLKQSWNEPTQAEGRTGVFVDPRFI